MSEIVTRNVYAYLGGVWTDITEDCLHLPYQRGGWGLPDNKPTTNTAKTGSLYISLINSTGKYLPGGDNVISADWKKGTKIKYAFTYNGETHVRFYGVIDKIQIDSGLTSDRKVHITVVDWMNYAAKHPLKNPAIELNKRADEALTTIVNAMPIAPLATDFGTGTNTFPTVFNDATQSTRAYSEFNKLAISEHGYIYVKKDKANGETLVFEASDARPTTSPVKSITELTTPGFLLKEDGGYLLKEDGGKLYIESYSTYDVSIDNEMMDMDVDYGANLINRVTITANPTQVAEETSLLFELDSPLYLNAGEQKTFSIQFTDPSSGSKVTALPPDDVNSYPQCLLHFDEETSLNPVKDEAGHSWGFKGGATLYGGNKVFGGKCLYLDGGTDTYIDGTDSADYDFGSGDFTIEWREYRFNTTAGGCIMSRDSSLAYSPFIIGSSDGTNSKVYISSNGSSFDIANGKTFGAIATNTWVSYAITRSGTTFRTFKNGVIQDTWTSSGTINSSSAPITIGKNQSTLITTLIDEFRLTKGKAWYTANYTPATEAFKLSGTFITAYTESNRSGTELSGDFVVTPEYGAAGAEVTVLNNSSLAGYLTTMKIYSYIVTANSPITEVQENETSINEYGYNELSINQVYQQDLTSGSLLAAKILEAERQPRVVLNKVTMNANSSSRMMLFFLNVDVGDLVEIVEDQTGIGSTYYIQGVEFEVFPAAVGVNVNFSWIVKEFQTSYSPLKIEFGTTGRVTYSYLPAVSGDSMTHRIWSYWSEASGGATTRYAIEIIQSATRKEYIYKAGGILYFASDRWTGSGGLWSVGFTTDPTHVLISYDRASTSSVPYIYLDGVLQSLLSSTQPTGTLTSEIGCDIQFGIGPYGKMSDVRCYNGDQVTSVSALASALYAAGAGASGNTDGLVFNAFNVRANEYNSYVDAALTADMTLLDKMNLVAGVPAGTVTARAI